MSVHHATPSIHNPVGRIAADHPGVVKIGRAGWFAKGVVYTIAGFLALSVAAKASGWADGTSTTGDQEASPVGAIKTVAGSSGGTLLLWLLAAGMLLYAAWRVVSALLPGSTDAKGWAHRIGYVASAVMYTTFAISAIALARRRTGEPRRQQACHRHLGDDHDQFRRPHRDRLGRADRDRRRHLSGLQGGHGGCR